MKVTVNGRTTDLPSGASMTDLLTELGLDARWVVVERNRDPVARRDLPTTTLAEGDTIELVRAVAGG